MMFVYLYLLAAVNAEFINYTGTLSMHYYEYATHECLSVLCEAGFEAKICDPPKTYATCSPCPSGTYNIITTWSWEGGNLYDCQQHTYCNTPMEIVTYQGTATSDTICACNLKEGYIGTPASMCKRVDKCNVGQYMTALGCTLCPEGTTTYNISYNLECFDIIISSTTVNYTLNITTPLSVFFITMHQLIALVCLVVVAIVSLIIIVAVVVYARKLKPDFTNKRIIESSPTRYSNIYTEIV